MAKPEARESGASIQYFSYKKNKSDPDSRKANEKAYNAANEQIMLWASQFSRDNGGVGPPQYSTGKNIPKPKPNAFVPSKPKKKTSVSGASGSSITIDETTRKGDKADPTAAEETEKLKQQKALLDATIKELKEDAKAGDLPPSLVGRAGGLTIGNKGGGVGEWLGRNLVHPVLDVGGKALDLLGRPGAAASGAAVYNAENRQKQLNDKEILDQIKDPKKRKEVAAKLALIPQTPEKSQGDIGGMLDAANKGIQGKEHRSMMEVTIPALQKNIPALRPNKGDNKVQKILKGAPGVVAGLGADILIDPITYMTAGVVPITKARTAARTADEIITASTEAGKAAKATRVAEQAIKSDLTVDLERQVAMFEDFLKKQPFDDYVRDKLTRFRVDLEASKVADAGAVANRGQMPKAQLALGPGPTVGKGAEVTDEATHAARIAELADIEAKAKQVAQATHGFETLKSSAKTQARVVNHTKIKVAKKLATAEQLAAEEAKLAKLHETISRAEELRAVAKAAPVEVGSKLSSAQKSVDRLTRLASAQPGNSMLGAKLRKAQAALEAAKIEAIPENINKLLKFTEDLRAGKAVKLTAGVKQAAETAKPEVVDNLIAVLREAELAKAGTAQPMSIADELIASLQKAADAKTVTKADNVTLHNAADSILDANTPYNVRRAAEELLDNELQFGRQLTKPEQKAIAARELATRMGASEVQEAAVEPTLKAVKNLKAQKGPLAVSSYQKDLLFDEAVANEVLASMPEMERILETGLGKRFAIRFAGKDLGEFKPMGIALRQAHVPFELVGKLGRSTGVGKTFAKAFKMGEHFPGETETIRRAAEQSGILKHAEETKIINARFTDNLTREEAKIITKAIEKDTDLGALTSHTGVSMEELRQEAIARSQTIFQQQVDYGKYVPGNENPRYVYHYYRGGDKDEMKLFKEHRTQALRAGQPGPSINDAALQKFKPLEGIDEILIMQHRDYIRDLQRANFRQQISSRYGVLTDNPTFAQGAGLQEVKNHSLNKMFQDKAKAQGGKWYLPPEIHDTFAAMDRMMEIGANREAADFLRYYDQFIRGFKTSATVANPSNWVNNTVGDFFLNYLDGVHNPAWYKKAGGLLRVSDDATPRTVSIGGRQVDGSKILLEFKARAPAGGFIRTEGGKLTRFSIPRKVQNAYETREEWVRLAHYLKALDTETSDALRRGANWEKAFNIGNERAARRVAKWNIDYSAITPFERKVRKYFIPFYTFMRKATPLMLEAMVTRPGKIASYQKSKNALEVLLGVPPQKDDGVVWPFWAEQAGKTRLTSGEEPYFMKDITPMNVLGRVFGGDSNRDLVSNQINQASPPIKAIAELGTGSSLFNGREITDWGGWLGSQIPTASIIARAAGHPLSPAETTTERTTTEQILNFLGIPVQRMTQNRQQGELHRQMGSDTQTYSQVNKALAPFEIHKTKSTKNGVYYVLGNKNDTKTYGRFRDFNEAVRAGAGLLKGSAG